MIAARAPLPQDIPVNFIPDLKLVPAETDPQGNRLYTVSGGDHVDAATTAYRDSLIYDWLLTKQL